MDRPEEDMLFREIVTFVAHFRHGGELAECPIEILKNPIGGFNTVFSNKILDFLKVATGFLS